MLTESLKFVQQKCCRTFTADYFLQTKYLNIITNPTNNLGLFPAILGKSPWPKFGKNYPLNIKLGEINNKEHNKGSKIFPQNQVILDCFMLRIAFIKHKCFSIILNGSLFLISSSGLYKKKKKKKKKKKILLLLIGKIRHGLGKKVGCFLLGMGPTFSL